MKKTTELTRAEEEIMFILWDLKSGYVKDILSKFANPKPAYNTVSTIVRILEQKGVVKHKASGKSHEYLPVLTREAYVKGRVDRCVKDLFKGSARELIVYLTEQKKVSRKDLKEISKELKKGEKKKEK